MACRCGGSTSVRPICFSMAVAPFLVCDTVFVDSFLDCLPFPSWIFGIWHWLFGQWNIRLTDTWAFYYILNDHRYWCHHNEWKDCSWCLLFVPGSGLAVKLMIHETLTIRRVASIYWIRNTFMCRWNKASWIWMVACLHKNTKPMSKPTMDCYILCNLDKCRHNQINSY